MTPAAPLISVIIPSYNRAHVLDRAIDSALAQTHPHVEVIVVDDGSTDGTIEHLRRPRSPRVKVLLNATNQGPARARNLGIETSRGDYVAFLDSDDTWAPWKLEGQLARFRFGSQRLGAVYCGRRVRLADGGMMDITPTLGGDLFMALLRRNFIPLPTLMVSRRALQEVGAFDPGLPACEDWDLILRIARRFTVDVVPQPLVHYDGGGSDRMSARARAVFIANHRILRRFNGHRPGRAVLATHLALQAREILHLRPRLAARYAMKSLLLAPVDREHLALRTLRQLMSRHRWGQWLIQAYAATRRPRPAREARGGHGNRL